ncbi:hypothetical protein AYO44_06775 [Planctomycetaceae bacterium SCGC AG-212-F19]|nr:hypothetical protein AYO44_06775 [Planctomycetaceae bacterium SCGC AG-212-F19]
MKRRWRLWTGLALLLLVGALLLHPAVHWRLIGWYRGEAFYHGRPTSWWAFEIEKNYYCVLGESGNHLPSYMHFVYRSPPSFWEQLSSIVPGTSLQAKELWADPPIKGGGDALPLYLELLHRPEPKVRLAAVISLGAIYPRTEDISSILKAAQRDEDKAVRREANMYLVGWPEP